MGDALLYFFLGVGCDGCFAQIPEIEAGAVERGLNALTIMIDPARMVSSEGAHFGIESPNLLDVRLTNCRRTSNTPQNDFLLGDRACRIGGLIRPLICQLPTPIGSIVRIDVDDSGDGTSKSSTSKTARYSRPSRN